MKSRPTATSEESKSSDRARPLANWLDASPNLNTIGWQPEGHCVSLFPAVPLPRPSEGEGTPTFSGAVTGGWLPYSKAPTPRVARSGLGASVVPAGPDAGTGKKSEGVAATWDPPAGDSKLGPAAVVDGGCGSGAVVSEGGGTDAGRVRGGGAGATMLAP